LISAQGTRVKKGGQSTQGDEAANASALTPSGTAVACRAAEPFAPNDRKPQERKRKRKT